MKNIVLVGFMGAGKTMTAIVLSDQLNRRLVSTDECIVEREGRSINDIFAHDGEGYFRDVESQVVEELSLQENLAVDCGGGVVLREENLNALKRNGMVVYLKTSPEMIYQRVKHEAHRPLLHVDDPLAKINEMLQVRAAFYEKADVEVCTDNKTAEEVAQEIVVLFENRQ